MNGRRTTSNFNYRRDIPLAGYRNDLRWITLVNGGLRWFAVKAALQLSPLHPDIFAFVISVFVVRTVPNCSEPFRIYPNPRSPFSPLLGAWRRGQAGSSPFTPINVIRPFQLSLPGTLARFGRTLARFAVRLESEKTP